MIKVEHVDVFNINGAIRGMRNPLDSWHLSDTEDDIIGPKDLDLAQRLIKAGHPAHSKFLRQIMVSIDITAPWYWWKEMDQYRVGCTTNSCSSMYRLTKKPITADDFSINDLSNPIVGILINYLETQRQRAIFTKNKADWEHLIQMMPSSYNQKRTWTANYEVLRNIYFSRKDHKLQEWHSFCDVIKILPYGEELITYVGN